MLTSESNVRPFGLRAQGGSGTLREKVGSL
jgi:hypothetical protein